MKELGALSTAMSRVTIVGLMWLTAANHLPMAYAIFCMWTRN